MMFIIHAIPKKKLQDTHYMAMMKRKFKHWTLFAKHISPAFAKTQERRAADVCIACGKNPCECKHPNGKSAN